MVEKKGPEGIRFICRLDRATVEADGLLKLAHDVIDESHDHRTFDERRELIKNADGLKVNAAVAQFKAMSGTDLSTNNKLYMIMERYVELEEKKHPKVSRAKALDKFFEEFAAKYPQEFGLDGAGKGQIRGMSAGNYVMRSRGNGIV